MASAPSDRLLADDAPATAPSPRHVAEGGGAPGFGARIRRLNERLAVVGTNVFGSMWTFYGFLALALLPLAPPLAVALPIVQYASSAVIQLIALPLLAVGANVIGRRGERAARETHEALVKELRLLRSEVAVERGSADIAHQRIAELRALIQELPPDVQAQLADKERAMGSARRSATPPPNRPEPVVARETDSDARAHRKGWRGALARINERVAVSGTKIFGSMWTFYGLTALALAPIFPPLAFVLPIVRYTSTAVIQLAALPLLGVGGNIIGRRGERLARQTHEAAMQEVEMVRSELADERAKAAPDRNELQLLQELVRVLPEALGQKSPTTAASVGEGRPPVMRAARVSAAAVHGRVTHRSNPTPAVASPARAGDHHHL